MTEEIAWEWYDSDKEYEKEEVYALDIETDYDWNAKTGGEKITQYALAGENSCIVSRPASKKLLRSISGSQIVGHNSWAFDIPKLREKGVAVPYGADTLVLSYLQDERQPLNLEYLCTTHLGVPAWKEEGHASFEDREKFALYNARDSVYTLKLYGLLVGTLGVSPQGVPRYKISETILLPAKLALDECSRRGEWLDKAAIAAARREWEGLVSTELATLLKMYDLPPKFNINAPQQVGKFLLDMGAPIQLSPKSQKPACNKEKLQYLAATDAPYAPFCRALVRYREIRDQLKVIKKYEELAQSPSGRIHPEYYAYKSMAWESDKSEGGTVAGRTSCRNPNRQNLDRAFKHFIAPEPGKCLVYADYGALHIRIFAWAAQEFRMLDEYAKDPGWDPHIFFARRLYGKESISKEERQVAKSANFSLLYLGGPTTLQNYAVKMGLSLDLKTCAAVHKAWHKTFAGAAPFYEAVREDLLRSGFAETQTGRRRHFDHSDVLEQMYKAPPRSFLNTKFAGYLREAVNHHVLGFEPDIALPALAECHRRGLPICGFVHDSVVFEFGSHDEFLANKEQIEYCMTVHPVQFLKKEFNVNFDVPLVIDFEVKNG